MIKLQVLFLTCNIIHCFYRINPKSYEDAFVCAPDGKSDIFIKVCVKFFKYPVVNITERVRFLSAPGSDIKIPSILPKKVSSWRVQGAAVFMSLLLPSIKKVNRLC